MVSTKLPSGKYLLLTGIALVVLGVAAIASPLVAGKAVVYVIGVLLLISGAVQLISGLREDSLGRKLLGVILGLITGLAAVAVILHPLLGLTTITLALAIFFVIEGIWKIVASFSFRPAPGWVALLISGILGLILGWLIWREWPLSGLWAVGVLVGVNLLCTGAAMIALAITLKTATSTVKKILEQ
jgi:uncharacterized membrane protein HdeD (DUF308 family)